MISGYHFTRGAEEVKVTAIHHVYSIAWLGQLLSDTGFTDIAFYSGPEDEPFEIGSGRLLLTARREDS